MKRTFIGIALTVLLLAGAFAILTGIVAPSDFHRFTSSLTSGGRPSEEVVKMTMAKAHYTKIANFKYADITFGTTLESKGAHGPEGTKVYPVKVTYGTANPQQDVIYFWKDPFGEWQFTQEGR